MKEAMFWEIEDGTTGTCNLCHHRCRIKDGKRGICAVRENRNGTLYSLVYAHAAAFNIDPIEKKPLYHFLPGSSSFSFATRGCNFKCLNCQNCKIAQVGEREDFLSEKELTPEHIVSQAEAFNCQSISYTYTEPTIFFEYAYDTAQIAKQKGLKNIFVTNGYITPEALKTIHPYLDAANIDLKSFRDEFYRSVCGAGLEPVLETIRLYKELGIWVEITTLIIPSYNDSLQELKQIAVFIAGLGEEIPWHITAFFPTHKMSDIPPTPPETLMNAWDIGKDAGLKYVYIGNMDHEKAFKTDCPACGNAVIDRLYKTPIMEKQCSKCGYEIEGVWN